MKEYIILLQLELSDTASRLNHSWRGSILNLTSLLAMQDLPIRVHTT